MYTIKDELLRLAVGSTSTSTINYNFSYVKNYDNALGVFVLNNLGNNTNVLTYFINLYTKKDLERYLGNILKFKNIILNIEEYELYVTNSDTNRDNLLDVKFTNLLQVNGSRLVVNSAIGRINHTCEIINESCIENFIEMLKNSNVYTRF
ncbi:MAG TPA: hypothetical protein VL947_07305 [Cytophagales bacterium]|nr:hypothetical protein [Cytophagales bacterium]